MYSSWRPEHTHTHDYDHDMGENDNTGRGAISIISSWLAMLSKGLNDDSNLILSRPCTAQVMCLNPL